jgi:NAD(P)-dependent dehydrogenase (short-subunit alcohol dehydrogenase family)
MALWLVEMLAKACYQSRMTTHVLLTGASRGIGAAIAKELRTDNVRLVALSSADGDLSVPGTATRLWQEAVASIGHVSILINNAGVFERNPIDRADDVWLASWQRTMQINLAAAAEFCRAAVLTWRAERAKGLASAHGRIVNVASRAAYRGDGPDHWHYAASKAGMVAMTKTIARAYAAENICAFTICPGFTMTGMADEYLASRGGDKLLADIPLGRVATPEEVAEVVRWCALDAPASMTGAVIDVNGASYVR